MALETGIFLSQAIWLWRVRHVRKEAKKAGKTYDEYIAENPSKKLPRSRLDRLLADSEAGHAASQTTLGVTEKPATADSRPSVDRNASNTTLVSPEAIGGEPKANTSTQKVVQEAESSIKVPEKAAMMTRQSPKPDSR